MRLITVQQRVFTLLSLLLQLLALVQPHGPLQPLEARPVAVRVVQHGRGPPPPQLGGHVRLLRHEAVLLLRLPVGREAVPDGCEGYCWWDPAGFSLVRVNADVVDALPLQNTTTGWIERTIWRT